MGMGGIADLSGLPAVGGGLAAKSVDAIPMAVASFLVSEIPFVELMAA
jgi:hypothetical protein